MKEITIQENKYMINAIAAVAGRPSSVKLQALNRDGSYGKQILYGGDVNEGVTDENLRRTAQALFEGLPPQAFDDFPKNMPEKISLSMKVHNGKEEINVTNTLDRKTLREEK